MPVHGDSLNLAVGFFLSDRSLYLRPGHLKGMSVEERSEISASSPGVGDALARDPRPCDDPTPPAEDERRMREVYLGEVGGVTDVQASTVPVST